MKPVAFRVQNFKSIQDSGVCRLSGDGITILAGENESGKTALLSALRDFDLAPNEEPETQDYLPDDDMELIPRVSVCFEANWSKIFSDLESKNIHVADSNKRLLSDESKVWITRNLTENGFYFDEGIEDVWDANSAGTSIEISQPATDDEPEGNSTIQPASAETLLAELWKQWPSFIYFDAFDDILPRQIEFDSLRSISAGKADTLPSVAVATSTVRPRKQEAPQIVKDFLQLANIDLDQIAKITGSEKLLTNYLDKKNGYITGDFLSFWRRSSTPSSPFLLRVAHYRDDAGKLMLTFYIKDTSDQYLDQRSRGFRWFLSFYIRLAASIAQNDSRPGLLLIDEPGSFLHARAQRDVLSLFEKRIVNRDAVIYSTHSPYLIPADKLHRLKVVIKSEESGTRIADKLSDQELSKEEFSDTLSPILTAIGIDIREQLKFVGPTNIVVEGLSYFLYLQACRTLLPEVLPKETCIFPATGATTTVLLSSLFIGWGLRFIVALDNDDQGHSAKADLVKDMGVQASRVVQMKDGCAVEDLFSATDFGAVLNSLSSEYKLEASEKPGKALKRLRISKVVAAKQFSELVSTGMLKPNRTSLDAISQYMRQLSSALNY